MPVLLLLLLLPLLEIALFIILGGRLGIAPVLVLTILTLILGVTVLRAHQARAAAMMANGLRDVSPGTFLATGAFAALGAMLLILPGFMTDTAGLLLLLPPLQRLIMRRLAAHVTVHTAQGTGPGRGPGDVIEGDYHFDPSADVAQPPRQGSDILLPPDDRHGSGP